MEDRPSRKSRFERWIAFSEGLLKESEGGKIHLTKLLVVAGPTATGKSALAMELASKYPMEIISADSMQVYRGMDIGTDKPSSQEAARVRHHLIDVRDPGQQWSVQDFIEEAAEAVAGIAARGKIPAVVGGTGLYIRALVEGYPLGDAPPNLTFRRSLRNLAKTRGPQTIHAMLKDKDPVSWERLHPNDLKRVVRALEYYNATGLPISGRQPSDRASPYKTLMLGISRDHQDLHERIDNRVEAQFVRGFIDEVKTLLAAGFSEKLPSMQGLGYKEICGHLHGLLTLEESKGLIKRNTRRLAKRQTTWFSKQEGIIWLSGGKGKAWDDAVKTSSSLIDSFWGE